MMKRLPGFAGVLVFAAALFVAAPSAKGQALGLPPAWKVDVTGTAATKAAGRDNFVEYIYIEATSFTGEQICQLGFEQQTLTATPLATGGYTVACTMRSNLQGIVSFSGTINNTEMKGTLTWTVGGKAYTYSYLGRPFTPDPNPES